MLFDKSCNERLAATKIPSMRYQRMRGDEILRGDNQTLCDLFKINEFRTRGHSIKLYKPLVQATMRKHCFSIRVINNWNRLPYKVVNAVSLDSFK